MVDQPGFPIFPDAQMLLNEVVKVTDRETKAFVWGLVPLISQIDGKAWGLNTLAEHFRAALMGVTPDESLWPSEHDLILADLDAQADAYNKQLAAKYTYVNVPVYPYK